MFFFYVFGAFMEFGLVFLFDHFRIVSAWLVCLNWLLCERFSNPGLMGFSSINFNFQVFYFQLLWRLSILSLILFWLLFRREVNLAFEELLANTGPIIVFPSQFLELFLLFWVVWVDDAIHLFKLVFLHFGFYQYLFLVVLFVIVLLLVFFFVILIEVGDFCASIFASFCQFITWSGLGSSILLCLILLLLGYVF